MRFVATCWGADVAALAASVGDCAGRLSALEAPAARAVRHLVEARVDLLARPLDLAGLDGLVGAAGGRLLLTCRAAGTGSPGAGDREALLARAHAAGAWVDLEMDLGSPRWARGERVIRSWHGEGRAAGRQAADAARELAAREPAIVKVVAPAGSAGDVLDWARAVRRVVPASRGVAAIAAGPLGTWLRLLAGWRDPDAGAPLSGASYVAGAAPLPGADLGQPSLHDAIEAFAAHRFAGQGLLAVVGWPLARSWSPLLHSRLLRRRGLPGLMVALPVRDVDEAHRLFGTLAITGVAVTMPHKAAPWDVERREPGAVAAGVVNTLGRTAGGWWGDCHDGPAAADALESALGPLRDRRVVVAGAGGAARAALAELLARGALPAVLARDASRARAAAAGRCAWGRLGELAGHRPEAVVHATPAGSDAFPDEVAVDAAALPPGCAVLEMVTSPPATRLLRLARERGLPTVDGLAMLARQAAAQHRAWFPGPAPSEADVEADLRELVAADEAFRGRAS